MEEPPRTAPRRARSLLASLTLALVVFLADQAIKLLIEGSIRLEESVPLIPGTLHLTHIENSGGAFGILAGQSALLLLGSAAAVGVVMWMLLTGTPSKPTTLGCGLILGGAAGNLLDRLAAGEVTDYVDLEFWPLRSWPVFNAADAAITLGVLALLLGALWPQKISHRAGH